MNKIDIKTNKRKGFTLIESIMYIAMSSVILGMALLMLYSLIQYRAKDKIRRDVDSEVLRVLEYLSQNIRNSQTLEIRDSNDVVVTSGFGQKLFVDTLNINNTYTNILIYLDDGIIKIDKNLTTSSLSSNLVRISNLQFRYLTGSAGVTSGAEIVDIQFVAEYALAGSSAYEYQRNIAVSVKLR